MKTLLLALTFLSISAICAFSGTSRNITTASAQRMSKGKNIVILDVRTPEEYAKGHLVDALLMNFYDKTFANQLKALPRQKTVIIYCKSGRRSTETLAMMKKLGFQKAYNMIGGFDAWSKEKRPSAR
ncbi:MAG: rhodanese-like domain-containing protein [Candidatus Kapabacteria bacterium]|nr:rhodanese-like domain-containing protein [Candidatus Kapabacteria bacterium]